MNLLFQLASLLGIETEVLVARLKRDAVIWLALAGFAGIAVAFLLVAACNGLSLWVGPIWAPLIIAAGALIVALTIYLVARLRQARAKRQALERRVSGDTTALITTALITVAPMLLKSQLLKSMALPMAGVAAAAFMLLRPARPEPPE